jgi:hypothetical protein
LRGKHDGYSSCSKRIKFRTSNGKIDSEEIEEKAKEGGADLLIK